MRCCYLVTAFCHHLTVHGAMHVTSVGYRAALRLLAIHYAITSPALRRFPDPSLRNRVAPAALSIPASPADPPLLPVWTFAGMRLTHVATPTNPAPPQPLPNALKSSTTPHAATQYTAPLFAAPPSQSRSTASVRHSFCPPDFDSLDRIHRKDAHDHAPTTNSPEPTVHHDLARPRLYRTDGLRPLLHRADFECAVPHCPDRRAGRCAVRLGQQPTRASQCMAGHTSCH